MALGGEVDDGFDRVIAQRRLDDVGIADVAFDEGEAVDAFERREISGVGERIEHDQTVRAIGATATTNEVGADEAGAASDQEIHEVLICLRWEGHIAQLLSDQPRTSPCQ